MSRTGCETWERRGPWEGEQERSECCFVVNTFYDLDQAGLRLLLDPTFPRKLCQKNRWGTEVNGKMFSIFWVWLAGFLSFLFLSVQFNSVRCWSWSEFKYYRKEKTREKDPRSIYRLPVGSSVLTSFKWLTRPESRLVWEVQSSLSWLFKMNNLAFSWVSPHQSPVSRSPNQPKKCEKY